jgi:hypothetical protein
MIQNGFSPYLPFSFSVLDRGNSHPTCCNPDNQ